MIIENDAGLRRDSSRELPGPRGAAALKFVWGFYRDPLAAFNSAAREYGPFFHLKVGPYTLTHVAEPGHVYHVLHSDNYEMSGVFAPSQPLVGEGLATNKSESWLRQRRMVQPVFHQQQIACFTEAIAGKTATALETWRGPAGRGEIVSVMEMALALNHQILLKTLFGVDYGLETEWILQAMNVTRDYMARRLRAPVSLPATWPTPGNRRFCQAVQILDQFIYGLIGQRRSSNEGSDVLLMLSQARDQETGEGMSDRELHDEILTLFYAAYEDPANALAWILYLLAENPAAEERLRAEIALTLGGRRPAYDDLRNLSYLTMVVEEGLRLYPPTWSMLRDVVADDEIDGVAIPKGSLMLVNIYASHRLPDYWPNPDVFDPTRFTPEQPAGRPRYAYYPFSGGSRQCIGSAFAMMEIKVILAMLLQRYRLALVPGVPVRPDTHISLHPAGGLPMIVRNVS
ncbi:MAG: cytochrome P450 [Chloroflexi bacterium]|nr:cytochrome P450 [Chloroflexota bacterium]MCI0578974.1 cytochrome P450 [Chloroflexota bacterium]MCI0645088.1 cytochrome P450 [Chloroflexota bacterium]MCI0731923.1 cytochrome P450 [Chloroflexota bacterium]